MSNIDLIISQVLSYNVNEDIFDREVNSEVDSSLDKEDFRIENSVGQYRVLTRRHDFKNGCNYWTLIFNDSKSDGQRDALENSDFIPYCRKSDNFKDALKSHFSAISYFNELQR